MNEVEITIQLICGSIHPVSASPPKLYVQQTPFCFSDIHPKLAIEAFLVEKIQMNGGAKRRYETKPRF